MSIETFQGEVGKTLIPRDKLHSNQQHQKIFFSLGSNI